jgi:hypothetical protein
MTASTPWLQTALNSSWMKFCFDRIVTKHLDISELSKVLLPMLMLRLCLAICSHDMETYLAFSEFVSRPASLLQFLTTNCNSRFRVSLYLSLNAAEQNRRYRLCAAHISCEQHFAHSVSIYTFHVITTTVYQLCSLTTLAGVDWVDGMQWCLLWHTMEIFCQWHDICVANPRGWQSGTGTSSLRVLWLSLVTMISLYSSSCCCLLAW